MIIHVLELSKSCKSCSLCVGFFSSSFLFLFFMFNVARFKSSVCLLGCGPTERRRIICGFNAANNVDKVAASVTAPMTTSHIKS